MNNNKNNMNNRNSKNNKRTNIAIYILVMCILIVMIGFGHIDLALSRANGENVTFDLTPLIIIGYIFCAMIVIRFTTSLILGIVYGKKWKKISIAYQNKDYAFVVSNNSLCSKLKKNKHVDNLYLIMAISYLELGNRDEFLRYLGKIQDENAVGYKYFWMAVNAILENSVERFNFWYAKTQSAPNIDDAYNRTLELIKKRLIDNIELTEEEQSFIDKRHTDTIKNLFNEPVRLCLPTDDYVNTDGNNFNNDNGDFGNEIDNDNDDSFLSADDFNYPIIDVDDDIQNDENFDESALYDNDYED